MQVTFSPKVFRHLTSLNENDRQALAEIRSQAEYLSRCSLNQIKMMGRSFVLTDNYDMKIHFRLEEMALGEIVVNIHQVEYLLAFAQDRVSDHERTNMVTRISRSRLSLLARTTVLGSDRKDGASTATVRLRTFTYAEHGILSAQALSSIKSSQGR